VAVDAETLEPLDSWRLPEAARVADSDWGTSPVLFGDSHGRELVAAANKNGYLYAFARNRLSGGPVWRRRVAAGGSCPNCGAGTASTGSFDGRRLFQAGGSTKIGRHRYAGSVRALDPASGRVLWSRGLPDPVLGALARAPGMLLVAAESGLYVLRARDGAVLHLNRMRGDWLWGAPLVDGRRVVVGTLNGRVRAYRLRTGAAAPRRPAP
jgi:outer membrane protein assembly factor BamB